MVLKTYLNIIYAVQLLSYFSKNPKESDWKTVQYVFRYLKNTHELWLTYGRLILDLYGYMDTNRNIAEDWHSTSGYAFLINSSAISWSTKHQELITLLTTGSKYIIATHISKEALWLYLFISEIFGKKLEATILFSDNQFMITLT